MNKLPRAAQYYLVAILALGVAAIALSQVLYFPPSPAKGWELAVFIGLGILAGSRKVSLSKKLIRHEEAGSMSLGFAITFAALLKFGPSVAVATGCASCLSSCLYPKRQAFHQIAFNVALGAIEAVIGGFVFLSLNGWTLQMRPAETFIAVAGTSLAFYVVNTFGVAIIIALCSAQKTLAVWQQNFLWTAPSYFATGSISALAMLLFRTSSTGVLLFILPVAYLVYQSYVTYIGREQEKQQHIEALELNQAQLADLYLATIKSLALAIDAKDQYTHQHILRVERYAVAIATEMGFKGADLQAISTGALLHDIGKLGVPEYVLLKPGKLTPDEFDKIKKHPEIGAAILGPVEFPWPVLPIVRHHHEKFDGTGYPDGLKGEDMPMSARIMAVADVYDAVTSTRSYRRAWTHEKAVSVITKDAGTHFDPEVVDAFNRIIDQVVEEMARDGEGPLALHNPIAKGEECTSTQAARDISRSSAELWALYEVAQILSSSLGIADTIVILSRKMESIFPGAACVFLLKDPKTGTLNAGSSAGLNQDFFEGAHTMGERSLSVRCLSENRIHTGDFDSEDLMLIASPAAQWTDLQSSMIVPIVYQGRELGTINLYHSEEAAFNDYAQQLLEMIAERAAPALYNGSLFERSRGDDSRDPLTGLFNVRYLTEQVEALCQQRSNGEKPFSLLCLDLDSFKPINDSFGHDKGDAILRELAEIFTSVAEGKGTAIRYGGDEFVIVLEDAGHDAACGIAHEIIQAVESYDPGLAHYKHGQLSIGVSIGTSTFPQDGCDCASLISAADTNMYELKAERKLLSLAQTKKQPKRSAA